MGWKSIHWAYTEYPQRTRFERYADDSWMLLIAFFQHVYIAFKGQPKWQPRRQAPTDALPLDPKPWLERPTGVRFSISGWGFAFCPREGYEQDRAKYDSASRGADNA